MMAKLFYSRALSFKLFSLLAATDPRCAYQGKIEPVALYPKGGGEILFPPRRQANHLQVSRLSFPGEHT